MNKKDCAFKLYSNGKIKTFETEEAMIAFRKEKNVDDFIYLKFKMADEYLNVCAIMVKTETEKDGLKYLTEGYLHKREDGSWEWLEDVSYPWYYESKGGFKTANEAIKDFISWKKSKAVEDYEGSPRYSVFDVYSPSELGLGTIKD